MKILAHLVHCLINREYLTSVAMQYGLNNAEELMLFTKCLMG